VLSPATYGKADAFSKAESSILPCPIRRILPPAAAPHHPAASRAAAREESACTLEELCSAAAFLLRTGGGFFVVYRPERLAELFCAMADCGIEPKRLRMVQNTAFSAPSLVLAEGRRGGRPGLRMEPPLILHESDGCETAEYKRIYHISGEA
jgi:tRNA1Val (adenine37-N6)-methyltransferase